MADATGETLGSKKIDNDGEFDVVEAAQEARRGNRDFRGVAHCGGRVVVVELGLGAPVVRRVPVGGEGGLFD
ncbi:hypothetical protein OG618_35525 [Kitasatospora sp. NBC_01246]|uniref:hypothetical protein n=1 Tax=Kitasatospora sp. NBC_01246 TaxID=2903570 RepID=UPI002E37BC14|nr:hypothetical protein [Kitasatospora sp. NBC_01246]